VTRTESLLRFFRGSISEHVSLSPRCRSRPGTRGDTEVMASLLSSLNAPGYHHGAVPVTRPRASSARVSTSGSASGRRDTCALGTIGACSKFGARKKHGSGSRRRDGFVRRAANDDDSTTDVANTKQASGDKSNRSDDRVTTTSSSQTELDKEKVDYVAEFKKGVLFGEGARKRFTEARIDDKGLPIADALVVTAVSVFVATVVLGLGIPRPSWLVPAPWVPKWRSLPFLVPALSHGAKLSCAWIPGALAAKAYERDAYDTTVNEAVKRTVKAGCFAVGILILATQFQLKVDFLSRGMPVPTLGDSPETDLILNGIASELIADSVFEAFGLIAWRVVRCSSDIPPDEDVPGRWF
jgi:hypothetical protein